MNEMIEFSSVSKSFSGRNGNPVKALQEIDLEVRPGEFLMVTGPSGSGKSTLLFSAGGMQQPSAGRVLIGGTDIYRQSPARRAALRRSRIGFVFQTFNQIPYLSCLENVALPALLAGRSRRSAYQSAHELIERLGLRHRLSHRPAELSVGERQRTAICRSLINAPDVVLADEPTGNLDSAMTEEVMKILLDLNSDGQTIVMATHDLRLAEMGKRVISLDQGRILRDRRSDPGECRT